MGCAKLTIKVLEQAKRPLFLHEIHAAIWSGYRLKCSEAAISARIRNDCRPMLAPSKRTILNKKGANTQAHVYWIAKLPKWKKAGRELVAGAKA